MTCPNCKKFVCPSVILDSEHYCSEYRDTVKGTCFRCGKSWHWVEVFHFSYYTEVTPIKNDHP